MIIRLKNGSIKKCLNQIKLLAVLIKIFFFILTYIFFLFQPKNIFADECVAKTNLKIGLIQNEYIDYRHYLYYELGNYSLKNSINFEFDYVDKNIDNFDIIFGEYFDLIKLTKKEIIYPEIVSSYYKNNKITNDSNLLPLDLDTIITVSKSQNKKANFLEDLSNLSKKNKYTLGISFLIRDNFTKLISYNLGSNIISFDDISLESTINQYKKMHKNFNNNILESNFSELYNSHDIAENIYTVFNDGILLYKNLKYSDFDLFPISKYKWDKDTGTFKKNNKHLPFSFYGFSAYINNTNHFGFICHLLDEDVRLNTFKSFNIQISPLSIFELNNFDREIDDKYKLILENKNKNILNQNEFISFDTYNNLIKLIFEDKDYSDLIKLNYLNK